MPTSYFQRWLQDNNKRVSDSIAGLTAVIAELEVVVADLAAQEAQLETVVATLSDVVDELVAQQAQINSIQTSLTNVAIGALANIGSSGTATGSPNGSGLMSFAHGYTDPSGPNNLYPAQIKYCSAQPYGGTYVHVQLISVDTSQLTIELFDNLGLPLTSGTFSVVFRVSGI
jgi:hypothetical protein